MQIKCPWFFISKNYHIRVILKNKIRINTIFEDRANYFNNELTNEILLTFSDVISTINKENKIVYNEFIIKVKMNYNDKDYYFPVITFVNDEYSLIRGYMLGFQKKMSDIFIAQDHIQVNNKYISFKIQKGSIDKKSNINDLDFKTYPFILYKDFDFGKKMIEKGVSSLDTRNYKVNSYSSFAIDYTSIYDICSKLGIDKSNIDSISNIFIEDEFELKGSC